MHFFVIVISEKGLDDDVFTLLCPHRESLDLSKGHWDWYQIGGRYTGVFNPEYDPREDPDNIEICNLCQGTGKREDMVVANGCNGCRGTGRAVKYPTKWIHKHCRTRVINIPKTVFSYAILEPDGTWSENKHSWRGIPDDYNWETESKEIFSRYPDHVAVVVDCHS